MSTAQQPHRQFDVPHHKNITSEECQRLERQYGAHNYHPLPVVFATAHGCKITDPEGREYYDFLSAYSAVNQGHCHPKIIQALCDQAHHLTLSSRAFYNDKLGEYCETVTKFFGFEMMLPMNTGAEGVETAMKLARKWGYEKKHIPENEAIIVCCSGNFHGRTIAIISMSTDPSCKGGFGPFVPGLRVIPYNDVQALSDVLEEVGDKVCGFLVEPIQGEAGVFVPDDGYLARCKALCEQHNVLLIADEVQTGIARTGRLLCCDWDNVHPDILILGKALGGGVYPCSAVLSTREIMLCINPGEHGSTFGGNPLAAAVGIAALGVVRDEHLTERADELGNYFREKLREIAQNNPIIQLVRGRGLLNAIVIREGPISAWDICMVMKQNGLLAKPTHDTIIRLAPPLTISRAQLDDCLRIIRETVESIVKMRPEDIPREH
ncbi:ornithine aminotransferase [Paratrimastix pyriformis]|uniref:Ornithine aminotransferase n=1 Tax=Paratrimastix pyriformis TaxID=342808 RepID=A0ABQ8URU6_9EUKA|nr:ornithine aminotransferase [Paratrimastix pyriformis]|eukprot:GAFH01001578.1.p1 GENE.GAFH01001578.1~~GAFH01001578.1.p1  ORF type:complete len:436 (-),score=96.00 GAFH01001578.1:192-1499(-)